MNSKTQNGGPTARRPHGSRIAMAGLLAGASLIAIAGSAQAAEAAAKADDTAVEELVVTGSRVVAPGLVAPTPVTSLSAEALAVRAPSNIADGLNRLPQFQNSFSNTQSRTFSATSTQTVQGNYLNLRGLGTNRGLVLLDGVRLPPTDASGGVDLNTLPQILVKRVDVVTGGASAAYGSDAVVGVVNFILDKEFTGFKGSLQGGISSRNDDKSFKASAAYGLSFADGAGHLLVSGEHYDIDGLRMYDRTLGDHQYLLVGAGAAANPYRTIENARFNNQAFGGLIANGPLAGNYFRNDGTITRFIRGTPTVTGTIDVGGDGAYHGNNSLNSRLRTDQLFTRVSYEIAPNVTVYAQASFGESRTFFDVAQVSLPSAQATIFADNAFLSPAVKAALGTTASFGLGTLRRDLLPNANYVLNDSVNAVVGAEGKFGESSWGWDVNYVYGFTKQRQTSMELKFQNFYAALDAVRDGTGNIVCRVSITNPGRYPGCAPLNLFGEGNASIAARQYIRQPSQNETNDELNSAAVNLHGNLFKTWAGPIAVAFGGEIRKQKLDAYSNADPAVPVDFTGLRGVPTGSLGFIRLNAGVASGDVTVKEGYGEAVVPLARDVAWAKSLDVNGAIRLTDYSTSGTVTTWKLGLSYQPISDLRFRGTISKDIAAPTLAQLYAGARVTLAATGQTDYHTGLLDQFKIITKGNPGLIPEEGKTYTAGVVYQPGWLPGFSVSVDAYSLKINNAIDTPGYDAILRECEASNGASPACALVDRPLPFSDRTAANNAVSVSAAPVNIASLKRTGIDFEASYHVPVSQIVSSLEGELSFRVLAAYSPTFNRKANSLVATEHYAGGIQGFGGPGYAFPKLSGSFEASYANGPLVVTLIERLTGSYRVDNIGFSADNQRLPNVGYTDLNIRYAFGGDQRLEGFLSVQNLFDQKPPFLADVGNAGLAYPINKQIYDVVGTYATVGVRFKY